MIDNAVFVVAGTLHETVRDMLVNYWRNSILWKPGGATAEIMCDLLPFEADRRAVNITIISIGTESTRDAHWKLYSNFGLLHTYGHEELVVCEDIDQMSYGESQMLDKAFYEEEVRRLCLAFEQQFQYTQSSLLTFDYGSRRF